MKRPQGMFGPVGHLLHEGRRQSVRPGGRRHIAHTGPADKAVAPAAQGDGQQQGSAASGQMTVDIRPRKPVRQRFQIQRLPDCPGHSRGQQTVVQKILPLIPYFPPVFRSAALVRQNGVGEETTLTFRAEIFSEAIGKTTNTVKSISYTWKEGGSTTAQTGGTSIPAQTSWNGRLKGDTDAGFSAAKSFTLDLMITDAVTTTHLSVPLNSGVPVLDIYRRETTAGAAVNKRWERGALDVGGMIYMDNKSLLDFFYPVNSIYISYSHTDPGTLFGGTWQRITNAFLWAAGAGDSIGDTGGEKTHTLTADELPKLSGNARFRDIDLTDSNTILDAGGILSKSTDEWSGTHGSLTTENKASGYKRNILNINIGGGEAHNNMPPYVQVSIWRRTA